MFRQSLAASVALLALVSACSLAKSPTADEQPTPKTEQTTNSETVLPQAELETIRSQIAQIPMTPDTSFLTEEEKQVVNLLIDAANLMSDIYLRQVSVNNPDILSDIESSDLSDKALVTDLYNLHFGPWDTLNHDKPFFGTNEKPVGAGFYPEDMTKEEFNSWIENHPEDADAFNSGYTVIRRTEDGGLEAIPYSIAYAEFLKPAAAKLREASDITSNESLKRFLNLRADAFLSDDYYESEMAWMDLTGPIEVAIGPYEVYTDGLFGTKTAFEAFVTVRNPEESAALEKYKGLLRDMEANLPVPESYKNFRRGFESPISVTEQIHGGGDNVPGVQTIAFNLPNDERVREAKGAKKVLLNNVMGAKFDRILAPMAQHVLVPEQASLLMQKYMGAETLFHELSHSLGPGTIVKDGRETTVNAEFKELYSAIEEGKADVMGAYNILFMMERGELPAAEKEAFLATYFTGLFRAMRFGIGEAHGKGAAFQYTYFKEIGAFSVDETSGLLQLDFAKLEQGIRDLTRDVVILQADGNYDEAAAFLSTYGVRDEVAERLINGMSDIPVDIQPIYPEKL